MILYGSKKRNGAMFLRRIVSTDGAVGVAVAARLRGGAGAGGGARNRSPPPDICLNLFDAAITWVK